MRINDQTQEFIPTFDPISKLNTEIQCVSLIFFQTIDCFADKIKKKDTFSLTQSHTFTMVELKNKIGFEIYLICTRMN